MTLLIRLAAESHAELEQRTDAAAAAIAAGKHPDVGSGAVRRYVVADEPSAVEALVARDPRSVRTGSAGSGVVSFAFPGLGAPPVNIEALLEASDSFQSEVDRLAAVASSLCGEDVREWLRGSAGAAPDASLRALLPRRGAGEPPPRPTIVAHVTLFVVEYALVTLWKELGVVPRMLIGHSLGEYVAAAVAGVFSPKDALSLIVDRARLVDGLPAGGMLAVSLPRHEAACECVDGVAVAATNGPALTVLAGARDALRSIAQSLEERGIACRFLEASHAFHTAVMEPAAERLSERAATIELRPPKIPYVSNVTGRVMTAADACDPAYWGRHLCSPVRFHEGLRGVWSRLGDAVIEVGPGQTLSALVTQFSMSGEVEPRDVVATLNASPYVSGAVGSLLDVAGRCWLAGVELDDAAVERLSRTAGMKGEYAVRT